MRSSFLLLLLPLLLLPLLALSSEADASEDAVWVRYPALSPDGTRIVFHHRGDLWIVGRAGGEARRLTSHEAIEIRPVWSHDGKRVAFASDRHGDFDVFVVDAEGGRATRLTWHSANDYPCDFEPDGTRVLFTSTRQDAPEAILPSARIPELWSVPVAGGRPRLELTTPAEWARVSPHGDLVVYEDRKGYEDTWRKHHRSPVTRDLWVWNRADGTHERLTAFDGEDLNPVWSPDAKWVYFLSEADGTFNVHRATPDGFTRVTSHTTHPVRFLSIANDGTLCYGWDGGVYVTRDEPGATPRRVPIQVAADARRNDVVRTTIRKGATEMAVSPKGDEVAFVVRGDVFVASVEHGTTRRITNSPEQERSVSWGPDGAWLLYAGERPRANGTESSWNLYRARLARPDEDERFHRATLVVEEPVLDGPEESFQPVVSPDGKLAAFLRERDELCVVDLASGAVRSLVPPERNYSYADGDIRYAWSPDSRWLAVTYLPNRSWIEQVGVVEVATGRVVDVTKSGYYESDPHWTRDGRALVFVSNRHGRRAHGSWGADQDVIALHLTQAAFDRARLPEEDFERLREKEEEAEKRRRKDEADDDADDADEDAADDEERPPPTVEISFDRVDRRTRRLTMHSARIADFVTSPDGETCLYLAEMDGSWDVWMVRPRAGETRRAVRLGDKRGGELELSRDGKTLFVLRGDGRIVKADVAGLWKRERGGQRDGENGGNQRTAHPEGVAYAAELLLDAVAERAHLYEHMWRQAGKKFYRPDLHGVDWPALRAAYARFLPQIEDDRDFAELCSELLGELDASHTGCRWRPPADGEDADRTAALGLLFDTSWRGAGLRIREVLRDGPCDRAESRIHAGHLLREIDGVDLLADTNPWPLLDHAAGKRVRLRLLDPAADQMYEEVVRPIDLRAEGRLLYERMVDRRRAIVEDASGGRLGYVHVAGMNESSFRRLFREALGRLADKDALIVDTRFNGGGWLHDDLVVFLSGHRYLEFMPRGTERGEMGGEPLLRWARPSCVVMSEGNYSDAHMFPVAYRAHGLGKLVGAPVAGTATAVWWERLINPALVFGIPQVGMMEPDGSYLENKTLEPDVLVLTDPVQIASGVDEQLLAAVRVLLEELEK